MTSLMEKRVLAGGAAMANHSLYKEGGVNHAWFEEDVIDAITDILHWATRKDTCLRDKLDVDRVFRCVKTHLKAEAAEKIFDKDPEPVRQPIVGYKVMVKGGPKRGKTCKCKKLPRMEYCSCGSRIQEDEERR